MKRAAAAFVVVALSAALGSVGLASPCLAAPLSPRTQVSVDSPVDIDQLLQVTRIRAASMASTFYKYTFRQTVTEEDLNEDGSVKRREARVYDVMPSPDGTERHLVSSDGEPPSEAQVRKQEKQNAALKKHWERIRAKQAKAAAQQKAKKEAAAGTKGAGAKPSPAAATATAAKPAATAATRPPTQPVPAPTTAPAPTVPPGAPASGPFPPHAAVAPQADLPPLPACNLDDPESALRPPLPGSITRTRKTPVLAPEQARKARENTSDYSLWELLQLTDYEYAGACRIDDRPMHVLTYEPPETFDAANPVERVMTGMSGTIIIDGRDLQVSRAEGLTVAPLTWGAGLVKLKSAHVLLEYAKVQGEIWLPSRDVFEFDSRVILSHSSQRFTHVFDDFRKASVEVETEYEYTETPAPP